MLKTINGGFSPTRGTEFSAAIDLYANEDVSISAGETKVVKLGVKICEQSLNDFIDDLGWPFPFPEKRDEFMKSHMLKLYIRSSGSTKRGLIIKNGTGIIDMDYPGEIGIVLHKPLQCSDIENIIKGEPVSVCHIKKGEKDKDGNLVGLAQIILEDHESYLFDIDSNTKRTGGYGSTNS